MPWTISSITTHVTNAAAAAIWVDDIAVAATAHSVTPAYAAPSGAPVLERAVAWIDCKIEHVYEMGDHYFVLGRVTSLDADADHDGLPPQPLVFYRGTIGGFAAEG